MELFQEAFGPAVERMTEKLEKSPSLEGTRSKIPHILCFIHTKMNILQTKKPSHIYENIRNTIDLYTQAWKETPQVRFLVDADCREVIHAAEPRLLDYYIHEPHGPYQADICCICALYLTGGYYFDIDMRTVKPWDADNRNGGQPTACSFATVLGPGQVPDELFNSFLVSEKRHPVLVETISIMTDHYNQNLHHGTAHSHLGPKTLLKAYEQLNYSSVEPLSDCLLKESNLETDVEYPKVQLQKGEGCCCNNVVHNATECKVYFFSRIPGAGGNCEFPGTSSSMEDFQDDNRRSRRRARRKQSVW